jgi:hypothetical protein
MWLVVSPPYSSLAHVQLVYFYRNYVFVYKKSLYKIRLNKNIKKVQFIIPAARIHEYFYNMFLR